MSLELKKPKTFRTHLTITGGLYVPRWARRDFLAAMVFEYEGKTTLGLHLTASDKSAEFETRQKLIGNYAYISRSLARKLLRGGATSVRLDFSEMAQGVYVTPPLKIDQ